MDRRDQLGKVERGVRTLLWMTSVSLILMVVLLISVFCLGKSLS